MLSGLSPESPLGRIVQIRAENDPKILKNFTVHQRKIRNEWRNKKALKVSEKTMDSVLNSIKNGFIALSGGVTNGG